MMQQHPAVDVVVVMVFLCSLLFAPLDMARAFDHPPILTTTTRRQMMGCWLSSGAGIATASLLIGTMPENGSVTAHAVDVLRSKGCYSGEGEGCADLAEDNALIRSLQEKSFANKERNAKVGKATFSLSCFVHQKKSARYYECPNDERDHI
jgi:hypothetical protein